MKIPSINRISNSVGKSTRSFIADLGVSSALLPILLLELSVTGGRTYNAYQRGGLVEARERATEETLTAIFCLWGVSTFNKVGDKVGEKVLGFKDIGFEVGKDAVRNPIVNYLAKHTKYNKKALATFKFGKIISSILLTNVIVGAVIPKLNQAITRKYQKSLEELDNRKKLNENNVNNKSSEKSPPSFKGNGVQTLLTLTDYFQNDARYQLLSTDAGMTAGRAYNARNEHERNEIIFRDVSSAYFYLFCRKHLNTALNMLEDGKKTRLNTVTVAELDEHLQKHFDKNSYTQEEFERLVLGNKDAKIPAGVQTKITNGTVKLKELKGLMDSKTFIRAEAMSKLQPELEGKAILTAEQLKDVYSNGLVDNPEFLGNVFKNYTKGKSTNPLQFVPEQNLRNLKQEMTDYVRSIMKFAKGESITRETLKIANKSNFLKNTLNLGAGFAVSAYFLSTAIPRIQYWMTERRTGRDKFPGVEKYDK